jgi:hypothetical protein
MTDTSSKPEPEEIVIRLPNIGRMIRNMLPPEAAEHFRLAQREQMLAFKALIEAGLRALDEEGESAKTSGKSTGRVEISVE